ncbi:hypothetical protein MBLNU459_g6331t1 [Dothideomycetes sp. NU459]
MDELRAQHRREAKELQARITQKKKGATKKTRKGVNDECDALERDMKERHAQEAASLDPSPAAAAAGVAADGLAELTLTASGDAASAAAAAPAALPPQPSPVSDPSVTPSQQAAEEEGDDPRSVSANGNVKKPNRAKARLARRQAEQEALFARAEQEASQLPNQKAQERERMLAGFAARGLTEREIRADGHCLYSAVADQMAALGLPLGAPTAKPRLSVPAMFKSKDKDKDGEAGGGAGAAKNEPYRQVRRAAADYIAAHPDDFAPFLDEPLAFYVHKIRETGEWGGQLELMALAKTYGLHISVLQGDGRVEEIVPDGDDGDDKRRIWLAYYRHGFGLGEHYNSLHKTPAAQ